MCLCYTEVGYWIPSYMICWIVCDWLKCRSNIVCIFRYFPCDVWFYYFPSPFSFSPSFSHHYSSLWLFFFFWTKSKTSAPYGLFIFMLDQNLLYGSCFHSVKIDRFYYLNIPNPKDLKSEMLQNLKILRHHVIVWVFRLRFFSSIFILVFIRILNVSLSSNRFTISFQVFCLLNFDRLAFPFHCPVTFIFLILTFWVVLKLYWVEMKIHLKNVNWLYFISLCTITLYSDNYMFLFYIIRKK